MKNRGYQQLPPMFDPNNLDDEHEIQIKYDRHGNPVRIRKVKRWGCTAWLFAIVTPAALAALVVLWWCFFKA